MKLYLLSFLLLSFSVSAQTELYKQTQGKTFKLTKADKDSLKQSRNVKIKLNVGGRDRELLLLDYGHAHGKHYRGAVSNDPNSTVAISSLDNDSVMGMILTEGKSYSLANRNGKIVSFDNSKLPKRTDECQALDIDVESPEVSEALVTNKVVKVYIECDYAMFQKFGTELNTKAYVNGLFNQVATLYQNEGIGIMISEIKVWTVTDPYAGIIGSSNILQAFRNGVNAAYPNQTFPGNLAHLLTTRGIGGGIAYIDVLCGIKSYAYGLSMVYTTYSNVPTYSWSVECVTHELGHNLGSPHTQNCNWLKADGTRGALDNCYTTEGGCVPGPAPVNGGTIMSYCHLTSTGINFSNGFGMLPGNLIRSKVINAPCVTTGTPPTPCASPTGLNASSVTSSTATLKWSKVAGATSYALEGWFYINNAKVMMPASTKTDTFSNSAGLNPGTTYTWRVKADCSGWSDTSRFTTSANTSCATVTGLSYSGVTCYAASVKWNAVSGATSYIVTVNGIQKPPVTTTIYSITGLSKNTFYTVTVKPNCTSTVSTIQFTTVKGRCR
jgi:hypothetical protein